MLSFSSIKDLTNHLASVKVKGMLDENIDTLARRLKEVFFIDVGKFADLHALREAFCRRNVVVHNKGITDSKYRAKIPASKIGVRLFTDLNYLENLFVVLGQFIDYLDSLFSSKLRYTRASSANQLITPPESFLEST